jgi:hypothetical protein
MRVISTSGSRSFYIVLRELAASDNYDVVLKNESTKVVSTIQLTQTPTQIDNNMYQLSITFTDTYNEGDEFSFYVVETGGTTILHRNKIFVTDKVTQNYSQ